MGQFGNQPDFGVIAEPALAGVVVPPSAVFIGQPNEGYATCSIDVQMVGNEVGATSFTGLRSGTFLPIIITKVLNIYNIAEDKVILYR